MSYSVSGVMLMNMFGFTLAGADICGFIFDTTPELCTKWHVVGSFYPFSRNHNNWGQIPQEPWVFKDDNFNGVNALNVMRDAIKRKYSLIRYYYSNLFEISTDKDNTGTFFKPLFFEFPDDINAYSDIVYNVMLGSALKLSINPESLTLEEKDYYFPSGLWCAVSGNLNVGDCFTSAG
jgi:alpha-glucosidase (family GH31 glycosyl hydrolase)